METHSILPMYLSAEYLPKQFAIITSFRMSRECSTAWGYNISAPRRDTFREVSKYLLGLFIYHKPIITCYKFDMYLYIYIYVYNARFPSNIT